MSEVKNQLKAKCSYGLFALQLFPSPSNTRIIIEHSFGNPAQARVIQHAEKIALIIKNAFNQVETKFSEHKSQKN